MRYPRKFPLKLSALYLGLICLFTITTNQLNAQDSTRSLLDFNNNKLIKKVNSLLDSNQKKINKLIFSKADSIKSKLNSSVQNNLPREVEKPLPYERLLNTKYTFGRRAYQNTVSQFNYYFNADEELKDIILNARNAFQEDYTETLPFYDFDLATTSKRSIDSIIYRCNANIVLHDLRNNWIDDAYLLMAKAYLYHRNFDTAGSILQFINYSFDEKENGADLVIGSNLRNTKGKFSIASPDNNRLWENGNVRNESLVWQARNYFEIGELNQGLSLLQLLKTDAVFPARLHPFLFEQLAYGYYQMDLPDSAATYLIKALPNAIDINAKARWYFLIAQLWDKADKNIEAYHWYQKASQQAINPILSVYAKINVINIEAKNANNKWEELANTLERLTKREKYKPYSDIIYFEMAKLAIKNKGVQQAHDWLILSIKKNTTNTKQKQKAFELLGALSYDNNIYSVSKLAYDNLTGVLKTNPNYEKIILRKKWMDQINTNNQLIQKEDSLQYFYTLPLEIQNVRLLKWQKSQEAYTESLTNLFIEKTEKKELEVISNNTNSFNNNNSNNNGFGNNRNNGFGNNNANGFGNNANSFGNNNNNLGNSNNNNSSNNTASDFYFENKNSVSQGKQNFTQKWGERPNIDNWRRKTSGNIAYNKTTISDLNTTGNSQDASSKKDTASKNQIKKEVNTAALAVAIKDAKDLENSKLNWNKTAMANAQLFLLELNDFDKALPLYKKIIERNIEPAITERALLDMASQYRHDNQPDISDSIIQIVNKNFPKGYYATKKQEAFNKKTRTQNSVNDYKEAYFLTQIGNWDSLSNMNDKLTSSLKRTKWNTPYQFLKVKMYAQQRMDSLAIMVLDSIILSNQNELIREKAKNIIAELKKRKETEAYLKQLVIETPVIVQPIIETTPVEATAITSQQQQANTQPQSQKDSKAGNIDQPTITKEPIIAAAPVVPRIIFSNDSTEDHYVALVTNKVKEVFVKESQTAFTYLNNDEFKKQNLKTTYVQFDDNVYIVWIGPFSTQQAGTSYIQKIKPRLKNELISFILANQYEIYILGKSNILQIKTKEELELYKEFMQKNIYK